MILDWDTSLFYAINHLPHSVPLDWFFGIFWSPAPWIPIALCAITWMIWKNRPKGLLVLLALTLSLICIDRSIHKYFKPSFNRIRPSYDLQNVVTPFGKPGGALSFPSAHSANTAAAAACLALWSPLGGLIGGSVSFLVGFSRIYHGAHYPLDVMAGWAYGWLVAFFLTQILYVIHPSWRSSPSVHSPSDPSGKSP